MLMLDTHVLIWFFMGDEKLGFEAREQIIREAQDDHVYVCAMCFAEAAMLQRKRRINLGMQGAKWTESIIAKPGIMVAPVDAIIAADAGSFPDDIHGDPIDRVIMATARHHRMPLLTADQKILEYGAHSFVDTIDARL